MLLLLLLVVVVVMLLMMLLLPAPAPSSAWVTVLSMRAYEGWHDFCTCGSYQRSTAS